MSLARVLRCWKCGRKLPKREDQRRAFVRDGVCRVLRFFCPSCVPASAESQATIPVISNQEGIEG
jgi:hypothetical protein